MAVTQEEAKRYIHNLQQRFEGNHPSLTVQEKVLMQKFKECENRQQRISADIEKFRNDKTKLEALLKSAEMTLEGELGKANGYLEALVELYFLPKDPPPEVVSKSDAPISLKEAVKHSKEKAQ